MMNLFACIHGWPDNKLSTMHAQWINKTLIHFRLCPLIDNLSLLKKHESNIGTCMAGKFGGELILVIWQISQPAAKFKSANIMSFLYFVHAKAIAHYEANWWVWSLH